jgi:hypothetical protein
MVTDRKEQYHTCKKTDKASIAWDIMEELRIHDPPTRFLKKDYSTGLWHIVPDSDVRRKISQCLRERMVPVIPQTKKNKTKKRNSTNKKAATALSETTIPKRTTRSTTRIQIQSAVEEEEPEMETLVSEDSVHPCEPLMFDVANNQAQAPLVVSMTENTEAAYQEPETPAVPPMEEMEPARKRSSYYSLSTGTWQDYNPKTGTWQEAQPSLQLREKESILEEEAVPLPPPMPSPVPMRSEESNNRAWSDVFASSLASYTPSIFDFSAAGNTWENMLDPMTLPQLMPYEDDEESFMGSQVSSSSSATHEENPEKVVASGHQAKRTIVHCTSDTRGDCFSPPKKQKKDAPISQSVNVFSNVEELTLGQVLDSSTTSSSVSPKGALKGPKLIS